eukprot:gene26725-35405_t
MRNYYMELELELVQVNVQNFCAGLILGAVAKELFPQIDNENMNQQSGSDSLFGTTIGFFAGLCFIYALDYVIALMEKNTSCIIYDGTTALRESSRLLNSQSYQQEDTESKEQESFSDGNEHQMIQLSSEAVSSSDHRRKIEHRFCELVDAIDNLEEDSNSFISLLPMNLSSNSCSAGYSSILDSEGNQAVFNTEVMAERIDEDIHQLQYILDNFRRLLQGSGSRLPSRVPRIFVTDEGRRALQEGLANLKSCGARIKGGLQRMDTTASSSAKEIIINIHRDLDFMESEIAALHVTVEGYSFQWRRRATVNKSPLPKLGSTIPASLIFPVIVDCIVDGFLMGSTTAASHRAGFILCMATCVEMGFLSLAVSTRINRCTSSSLLARYCAQLCPPLLMLAACVLGSVVGEQLKAHRTMYTAFISFGIVMLLYLVVNDLLVEAREALSKVAEVVETPPRSNATDDSTTGNDLTVVEEGKEMSNSASSTPATAMSTSWWTAVSFFGGVYTVIILDALMK